MDAEMRKIGEEAVVSLEQMVALDVKEHLFFFSSRRRHTRCGRDWSSDVCSSDLISLPLISTGWKRIKNAWKRRSGVSGGNSGSMIMIKNYKTCVWPRVFIPCAARGWRLS